MADLENQIAEIRKRIAALHSDRDALLKDMKAAQDALNLEARVETVPRIAERWNAPLEKLAEEVAGLCKQFGLAAPGGTPKVGSLLTSLDELETRTGGVAKALGVLQMAKRIRWKSPDEKAPLTLIRDQVTTLEQTVQRDPHVAQRVADGSHPMAQLVREVSGTGKANLRSITSEFNDDIVRAALAGRLEIGDAVPPPAAPPKPVAPPPPPPRPPVATAAAKPAAALTKPPVTPAPNLPAKAPVPRVQPPVAQPSAPKPGTILTPAAPAVAVKPMSPPAAVPAQPVKPMPPPAAVPAQPVKPLAPALAVTVETPAARPAPPLPAPPLPSATRKLEPAALSGAGKIKLVEEALSTGRYGIAYHATSLVEPDQRVSPVMIRALACAEHLVSKNGELADALKTDLEAISRHPKEHGLDLPGDEGVLLTAALALAPAILLANSGAEDLLFGLLVSAPGPEENGKLKPLRDFMTAVYEFREKSLGLTFDFTTLRLAKGQNDWSTEREALRAEAIQLLKELNAQPPLSWAAGKALEEKWLDEGGYFHQLVEPVLAAGNRRVDALDLCRREGDLQRLANREIDEFELTKQKVQVNSTAYRRIKTSWESLTTLAERYHELLSKMPQGSSDAPDVQMVRGLTDAVPGHVANCLAALNRLNPPDTFARSSCVRILNRLASIFRKDSKWSEEEVPLRYLLHADLLRIPGLKIRAKDWTPDGGLTESDVVQLERVFREDVPSWEDAFQFRLREDSPSDFQLTAALLEFFERTGAVKADEKLDAQRKTEIEAAKDDLRERLDRLVGEVSEAKNNGLFDADTHLIYTDEINEARRLLDDPERVLISRGQRLLREVQLDLRAKTEEGRAGLANHPFRTDGRLKEDQLANLRKLAERGLKGAVENYYAQCLMDPSEPYPDTDLGRFRAYYSDLEQIASQLFDGPKPQFAGVDRSFSNLVEAWRRSAQVRELRQIQVTAFLEFLLLGYDLDVLRSRFTEAASDTKMRAHWTRLATRPVRDRKRIPLPQFGSKADGHYQLLCLWKPTLELLRQELGKCRPGGDAIWVLYFGRLTEEERQQLADVPCACPYIVVDELVLAYLAGLGGVPAVPPDRRLAALFGCVLPYAAIQPYQEKGGQVWPEMFFGREEEMRRVLADAGGHFVYGGRQLGKTALLRHIEKRYHQDQAGGTLKVIYMDLRFGTNIGSGRRMEEFWPVLAEYLKRANVELKKPGPDGKLEDLTNFNEDTVPEAIERWLRPRDRRLLILLDEADVFLLKDRKERLTRDGGVVEFGISSRLMPRDNTARWKVVFAGLRDVWRGTKIPNSPFSKIGRPIAIGPMMSREDAQQARELLEFPLQAVGVKFEKAALVDEVLGLTGYFPSLIQCFAYRLVEELNRRRRESGSGLAPPFTIDSRAKLATPAAKEDPRTFFIEDIFDPKNERSLAWEDIRKRFAMTLEVDPRFEVIAYGMARQILNNPEGPEASGGFDAAAVHEIVMDLWPAGFTTQEDGREVEELLSDLQELGIVVEVPRSPGRYRLRTGLIELLGDSARVDRELERQREVPPNYDETAERPLFPDTEPGEDFRMAPLTEQQLLRIQQHKTEVLVVVGSEAAGIRTLAEFLQMLPANELLDSSVASQEAFEAWLSDRRTREVAAGRSFNVVVDCTHAWDIGWVESAIKRQRLYSAEEQTRCIFVADRERLSWEEFELIRGLGIRVEQLRPMKDQALRTWLNFRDHPVKVDERQRLREQLGAWPQFLDEFDKYRRTQSGTWRESLTAFVELLMAKPAERLRQLGVREDDWPYLRALNAATGQEPVLAEVAATVGHGLDEARQRLTFLEQLWVVQPVGSTWRLNKPVAVLLERLKE